MFDGGHAQGAGGLDDAAGVDKHVFDGRAHRVGVHADEAIDRFAHDAKRLLAHQFDSRAVREQAHVLQRHPLTLGHRLGHGARVAHLHPNHLHLGAHRFDVAGHASDQPAAANGDKHRMQGARVLAQQFHGNRALAGDHIGVVKRVHKSHALLLLQAQGVGVGIGVALAMQHHLATQGLDGFYFEGGRGHGHHHHRACAQLGRAQRHTLGVVARRGANHPARELLAAELGHFVVRPAQLEAEHRLLVFALEQHLVVQAPPQVARHVQSRLVRHVVYLGGEDFLQVIGAAGRLGWGFALGLGLGVARGRLRN